MGNQQGKGTRVAVIKDPQYVVYNQKDYNTFFQDPDHMICSVYDNFDEFIEKQSLKNLHHIIIIQQHRQYLRRYEKSQQQNNQLTRYMRPIDNIFSDRNLTQIRTRDKVINYIKKYSLQNINLYIYVKEFKNFIIPENQVPYVTLVSTTAQPIMSHIINETTKNMASVKFKGFAKDLYRKKLVVVISKYCVKGNKSNNSKPNEEQQQRLQYQQKSNRTKQIIKRMQQNFKSQQNNFQYQMVSSVEQLSDKLKSMYFQFMICVDQQDLLQIIQFRKKMPIESKLIYYGNVADLGEEEAKNNKVDKLVVEKKKKQIWWISNDLQTEISPVMKKWWSAKTQTSTNDKISKNIIIFLNSCQNILQKQYIQQQLSKRLSQSTDPNIKSLSSTISINCEYKIQHIYKRLRNDLYTIVILFDATNQQFQMAKKIIMSKIKGEPRVQLSLLELKQGKAKDMTPEKLLQARIKQCSNSKYYEFKQQISPIQTINCLNLTPDVHDYFSYKIGLEVNVIEPQNDKYHHKLTFQQKQKKLYKVLENYFPKIVAKNVISGGLHKQKSTIQLQQPVFELWSTFENFYIVCSFDDYLRYLFPYLVLVYLYDKKRNVYEEPSKEHLEKIMNYMNRIKIIIYSEVEYEDIGEEKKIGLKELMRIHENPAQAMVYVKRAVCEFIELTSQSKVEKTSNESNKKQKKKDSQKGLLVQQILQQQQHQQKQQQETLKKVLQRIESIINKPVKHRSNNQPSQPKTCITFPNIQFVHFKLSQIQSHLKLSKYNRLSFSSFPKGSLKGFHQANKQIENIVDARSIVVEGSLGASNEQLQKIFEKNVVAVASHRMEFVKPKKGNEIDLFQKYIKKYSGLWKLHYQVMQPNPSNATYLQFNPQSFQQIKQSIIRAFNRSKNYELLKVSSTQFKTFYIDSIRNCKNLLDLQITAIYIYSLPHGMSDIVTAIFQSTVRSTLSLQIFSGFLFVLFLNFFSFHSRKLEKLQTIIYLPQQQMKKFYQYMEQNEIIFNKSMMHLMDNENAIENERNHCIVIQYENVPYMKRSSLSAILKVEELSFYKESAEYLLAPFTKLRLKKKQIVKGKYMLYFEIVHDNESNLFLKSFFQLNEINDIALFEALNDYSYAKKRRRRNKGEKEGEDGESEDEGESEEENERGVIVTKGNNNNNKIIESKNDSKKQPTKNVTINKSSNPKSQSNPFKESSTTKQFTSHLRHAEQRGIKQSKRSVQFSIRLNICFMKMLNSFSNRGLFTPEKYLAVLYGMSEHEQNTTHNQQTKKFELVKQAIEIKKLSIYQAMIYTKRHEFSKAIDELNELLEYLRLEGKGDDEGWLMRKVWELRAQIINMKMWRAQLVEGIELQGWKSVQEWESHHHHHNHKHHNHHNQQQQHKLMTLPLTGNQFHEEQSQLTQFNSLTKHQQQQKTLSNNNNDFKLRKSRKWKVSIIWDKEMFVMRDNSNKGNNLREQQREQYDIYCKSLLGQNHLPVSLQNHHMVSSSKILSSTNLLQSNKGGMKKQPVKLQHTTKNPTNLPVMNNGTRKLFQQLSPLGRGTIALFHVYTIFRDKLILTSSIAETNKQQQQQQNDGCDSDDELKQTLSKVPQCFVLQKFQIYVSQKLALYQQSNRFISEDSKEQNSIDWLQSEVKKEGFHQMHKLRKQLIQQYQFAQRQLMKTSNQKNSQYQSSWIDSQIIDILPQNQTKWSVFEFENKMIVVDGNRKWKQKLNAGDSGKKQASKIFYRQQNQLIQNQKLKRQLQQSQQNN